MAKVFTPEEEEVLYDIRYHLVMAENGFQQLVKIKVQAGLKTKVGQLRST